MLPRRRRLVKPNVRRRDLAGARHGPSVLSNAALASICLSRIAEFARKMAPRAGFEPATLRLTAGCSAVELPRNMVGKTLARRRKSARAGPVMVLKPLGHSQLQAPRA